MNTPIFFLRNRMPGTVATAAMSLGTGSLNIQATRLPGPEERGRWPANVIIQHLNAGWFRQESLDAIRHGDVQSVLGACRRGEPQPGLQDLLLQQMSPGIPQGGASRRGDGGRLRGRGLFPGGCQPLASRVREGLLEVLLDLDSARHYPVESQPQETISCQHTDGIWSCQDLCPCRRLPGEFFQQVASRQGLLEYLKVLVASPRQETLLVEDPGSLVGLPDQSQRALVCTAHVTADLAEHIRRVLLPGANLLLVTPNGETGFEAVVLFEDAGFDVRDCLLFIREAQGCHYVPKPSRAERDAGCHHLPRVAGHEAVHRKQGAAGTANPRAGAGGRSESILNNHPTVKPIGVMEALLADVPQDAIVLDPFLGSGTTALACLRTGHSAIGIEREEPFLRIATARARYWDKAHQGWKEAEIISDILEKEEEKAPLSLEALLGG